MDMVVGTIVDRTPTSTRWGRFRPYLQWGSVPLLLINVAVFSVPAAWSAVEKLAYAYITYSLLGTAYAFVNIPYGALASVMTQAPRERSRLSAARTLLSTATVIFLAGSAYVPNQATQTPSALWAITQGVALVPAIAFSAAFLIMSAYPLSDRRFLAIVQEIKARRLD